MRKFSLFMLMAVGLLISGNVWGATASFVVKNAQDVQVGETKTALADAIALLDNDATGWTITVSAAYTVPEGTYDLKGATLKSTTACTLTLSADKTYSFSNGILSKITFKSVGGSKTYMTLSLNGIRGASLNSGYTNVTINNSNLNITSGTYGTFAMTDWTGTVSGGTFPIASYNIVKDRLAEGKYLFRKASTCTVSTADKATIKNQNEELFLTPADAFACAQDNDVLTLLVPQTAAAACTAKTNFTFDFAGNAYVGGNKVTLFTVSTDKTLSLTNSGKDQVKVETCGTTAGAYYVAKVSGNLVVDGDIVLDASATTTNGDVNGATAGATVIAKNGAEFKVYAAKRVTVNTDEKSSISINAQAQIDNVYFESFASAFTYAKTLDGEIVITSLADQTAMAAQSISKNMTIDFNGYNYTGTTNKTLFTINAGYTVTLKNSSDTPVTLTTTGTTNPLYVASVSGNLIMSGKIDMNTTATGSIDILINNAAATARIESGVTCGINPSKSSTIVTLPGSNVTILSGTLVDCKLAQGTTLASSVEIKGGFYGDKLEKNLAVAGREFVESYCTELGDCYEVKDSKLASINGGAAKTMREALSEAKDNDCITLLGDFEFYGGECLNITKSIILDGQGHKISGYGDRSGNKTTLAINNGGTNYVEVTLKNLTIVNDGAAGRAIETRGNITSFTMENCTIQFTGSGNTQGLTIGGNQGSVAQMTITNSYLSGTYPMIIFNPIELYTENTKYHGFCSMYFRGYGYNSQAGAQGTKVMAKNCDFYSPNTQKGGSNDFGVFVLNEDGIDISLEDCAMNAERLGDNVQQLWDFSNAPEGRKSPFKACHFTITGNNSHLNGELYGGHYSTVTETFTLMQITGGTYSMDPSNFTASEGYNPGPHNFVPEGYEVSEVTQYVEGKDPVTLYRVHPKANVSNKLNDNVEGQGGGQNPNTSFILSEDETVAADKTYAEYVEIQSGTITIPTGKVLSVGEAGLVVKEDASMVVEPGGTVTVSKGGAITAEEQSIVIKSNVDETGNYLLDPAVTFNQQPLAKVELYTTAKKNKWQRFAFPLVEGTYGNNVTNDHDTLSLTIAGGGSFGTAINKWDYDNDKWVAINATTEMDPFIGYALSNNSNEGGVTYTFHGNIMGNVVDNLDFATNSYTLFGNSYTAPIDIKALITTVKEGAGDDVAGSIYLWSVANQGYVSENFSTIEWGMSNYTEIPALHTFIMLNNGQKTTTALDYEATVWAPMMNKINPSAPTAPANRVQEGNMMRLRISSENGHADDIVLMEQNQFSAEFEDGADADKYFNTENVNIYTTMDSKNLSILASDNIEGTNISIQTVDDIEYTITFTKVVGGDYALLDNATGIITPIVTDGTYYFVAQANTTLEGRFQIVAAHRAPTDEAKVVAKPVNQGVYTIMGQYVGAEANWNTLPAGVYIVNGIRIVK